MAELTLKDESVIQIGESVSKGFNDLVASGKSILINPTGQPLVSKADDISPTDDFIGPRLPETGAVTNDFIGPQLPESSPIMDLLGSIRDGIMSLVDSFTESLSFQKQEERESERAARISADDPVKKDEGTGILTNSFMEGMKKRVDSVKKFTAGFFGIFSGLFGKAALFGLLIAFAMNLDKFSGKISEVTKPIIEGLKAAFNSLKEDFVPVIEGLIEGVGLAFDTIRNILQGLFNWDLEQLGTGIKQLLFDIPIKLYSIIGDAFFSLLDAALNLFGVDAQWVQDVKIAFRTLPEAIEQAITNSIKFFTETIPQFFTDMKDQAIENARTNIAAIGDMFKGAFNFIVEDIPNAIGNFVDNIINSIKETINGIKDALLAPITAVKDKVSGFFGGVKDFFTGDDDKAKAEAMSNNVMDLESAKAKQKQVFDQIHEKGNQSSGYKNSEKARMKMYNAMVIEMDPSRGEDHKALNSTNPMLYADYDYRDDRQGLDFAASQALSERNKMREIVSDANNTAPNSNTPTITPEELQKGKELNQGSIEIADRNTGNTNVVTTKGGDSNITTANNTYTNIMEDTKTSDNSLRDYLSA
jgi:hypothetical protein